MGVGGGAPATLLVVSGQADSFVARRWRPCPPRRRGVHLVAISSSASAYESSIGPARDVASRDQSSRLSRMSRGGSCNFARRAERSANSLVPLGLALCELREQESVAARVLMSVFTGGRWRYFFAHGSVIDVGCIFWGVRANSRQRKGNSKRHRPAVSAKQDGTKLYVGIT